MVKSASYKTLLKSSMEILGPTLRELINSSITTGVVYPSWKRAIIRPKLKRQNLDPTLANHWPLSNFSFISKLSEKSLSISYSTTSTPNTYFQACSQLTDGTIAQRQPCLRWKNDLLLNMNRQHVTLTVFLDLSSAFDTVDHFSASPKLRCR